MGKAVVSISRLICVHILQSVTAAGASRFLCIFYKVLPPQGQVTLCAYYTIDFIISFIFVS